MEIDWITVSAQIVNFLILVALLRKFLYRPVIDAMERREERIATRLKEAERRENEAEARAREHSEKMEALERNERHYQERARREAEEMKQAWLDEARADVDRLRDEWTRQVEREKEEFLGALGREAVSAIHSGLRKALQQMADVDLEERIVRVFSGRIAALNAETRAKLVQDAKVVRIDSAFDLNEGARERLQREVRESIGDGVEVRFGQNAELLCGVELVGGGRKVSWSLASYLDELRSRMMQLLEVHPGRGS